MSIQVSYKKQITFFLILFLVIIIFIESGARIYEFVNPYCGLLHSDAFDETDWYTLRWVCLDTNSLEWIEDPILLYTPNQSFTTIHINDFGFRGPDINKEKDIGTYRIFVVGGSTTFGYGSTSDYTTISGYLQEEFQNNHSFKNIEVINGGIGHATSFEEKYLIQNTIAEFSPDLIIIFDGWNDGRLRKIDGMLPLGIVDSDKDPFKFKNYPFYRTPFVIWANIIRHYEVITAFAQAPISPKIEKTTTDLWVQNIKDVCKTQKERNTKTIIFLQPNVWSGNKNLSDGELDINKTKAHVLEPVNRILDNFAVHLDDLENSCAGAMDLRNIFDNTKKPVFYDEVHLNDLGNEIIAKKIYEKIIPLVLEDTTK